MISLIPFLPLPTSRAQAAADGVEPAGDTLGPPLARGLGVPMWAVKPWRRLRALAPCVPRRRAWLKRAFAAARLLERSLATLFFLGRCRFCACAAPRRRGGCVGARRGDGARGARVVAAALAGDRVGQTAQRAQTAGGRRALCRCAVPSKAPRGGEPRANSAPLRCVAGASATPLPNAMPFDSKRRRWRERRGLHTSCVPVVAHACAAHFRGARRGLTCAIGTSGGTRPRGMRL